MTKQQKENAEQRAIEKLTEMNIEDGKDIVIRFGDALPLQEPKYVSIHGTIDAPARWVEKRKDDIVSADAHDIVVQERDSQMDGVLVRIAEAAPNIVIIEQ